MEPLRVLRGLNDRILVLFNPDSSVWTQCEVGAVSIYLMLYVLIWISPLVACGFGNESPHHSTSIFVVS